MLFLVVSCDQATQSKRLDTTSALKSIDLMRLRLHMLTLAADEMEGREAATPGHQRAAEYVAGKFAEMGLKPLGDQDSYFQSIDFLESRIDQGSASMVLRVGDQEIEFESGEDFVRSGGFGNSAELITAPLVFAGFGINAPNYGHDDYLDIDVAGKIVVIFSGAPPNFSANERAYFSSTSGKYALATQHGAVGVVTIRTPADRKRSPWPRIQAASLRPAMRWLTFDDTPRDGYPTLIGNARLSQSGAEKLVSSSNKNLSQLIERHLSGTTGSFELGISATITRKSIQRRTSSPNVVALLPGSDRNMRDEYLLVTSHLDHLGYRFVDGEKVVYNGAYDNAAGVATMLEIALALSSHTTKPRRPVIFAAVTGEEKGLRGSDYLANNPPVPIENIIANLNIDMPYLGFPLQDVEGYGVEHSTLRELLADAASKLALELTPDSRPELVRLIRSDQFSFVKKGVPGLNLKPGTKTNSAKFDGPALVDKFLSSHYHEPSDNGTLPFNEMGARQFAEISLLLAIQITEDDDRPLWYEGDFFGDLFARDKAKAKK